MKNGVIVEVGSAKEDGSFQAFQKKVLSTTIDSKEFGQKTALRYVNRHGIEMKFSFNGPRIMNGKVIRLDDYQFFDGPFIQSEKRSGVITIRCRGKTRVLDFTRGTIQESN